MELDINFPHTLLNHSGESESTANVWSQLLETKNLKHSPIYTIILIAAYIGVFTIGMLGNGTVICVIVLKPRMRTVTNLFIFNLALSDAFVLLFCLPATLLASIYTPWLLGSIICRGVTYAQGVSVIASAYSLVAISLDRWKAICDNATSTRGFSKTQALQVIALIWLLSLSLPLPWTQVFILRVPEYDNHLLCEENWSNKTLEIFYFLFVTIFCCYVLPVMFIFFANLVIWRKVSTRYTDSMSDASAYVRQVHRKTRRGVGKMLTVVTFTFLLSWLPLYALATRVRLSQTLSERESHVLKVLIPLAQWLSYWNSCVNPVLYAFYNENFRKTCKSLLPSFLQVSICNKQEFHNTPLRNKRCHCQPSSREMFVIPFKPCQYESQQENSGSRGKAEVYKDASKNLTALAANESHSSFTTAV